MRDHVDDKSRYLPTIWLCSSLLLSCRSLSVFLYILLLGRTGTKTQQSSTCFIVLSDIISYPWKVSEFIVTLYCADLSPVDGM